MDERALLLDDAVIRNMLPTLGRSLTSVTYAALEHEIGEARDLALSVVYIGGELILRFEGVEQPVVVTWAENAGLRGRDALMALYAGYGNNIVLHGADGLVVHRSQDPRVVIIEYDVHGEWHCLKQVAALDVTVFALGCVVSSRGDAVLAVV